MYLIFQFLLYYIIKKTYEINSVAFKWISLNFISYELIDS